jgi:hypothetical protein
MPYASRRSVVIAAVVAICIGASAIGAYALFTTWSVDPTAPNPVRVESIVQADNEFAELVAEMLASRGGARDSTAGVRELAQQMFAILADEPSLSLDIPHERDDSAGREPTPVSRKAPDTVQVKRIGTRTEQDLRRELAHAPEVPRFNRAAMAAVFEAYTNSGITFEESLDSHVLLTVRPDLSLLPVQSGPACRLAPHSATTLGVLSNKLRLFLGVAAPRRSSDQRPDLAMLQSVLWRERRGPKPEWLRVEAIPALLQLLMHEDEPGRIMLIDLLTEIPETAATVALAQRAVFDLSPSVRDAAIRALQDRPAEVCRDVFLRALRHPWPPAAEHAAEALIALEDRGSVAALVNLLSRPDPASPVLLGESGHMGVREVVRIHHVSNCLMCHPPSSSSSDPVLGVQPGGANIMSGRQRSGGDRNHDYQGTANSAGTVGDPLLVRGDVTFLRQDFSVLHDDERFDYLVRIRPLRTKELEELQATRKGESSHPQREAVLFALRELTRSN